MLELMLQRAQHRRDPVRQRAEARPADRRARRRAGRHRHLQRRHDWSARRMNDDYPGAQHVVSRADARVADGQAGDRRHRGAGARDPAQSERDPDRRAVDHGPRPHRADAAARRDRGQPGEVHPGGRRRPRRARAAYPLGRARSRAADRRARDARGEIVGAERLHGVVPAGEPRLRLSRGAVHRAVAAGDAGGGARRGVQRHSAL